MVANRQPSEENVGILLADINRLARKEFDRRVRTLGLTRAQWLFLWHLAQQPGCTQSDLAERLQMEKISVSRHAERLLRSGWIERRDHADDGRAYHLFVSRKAGPIIEQLAQIAAELRSEYLHGLTRERRAALHEDLLQIKSNLVRLDADAKQRIS